MIDFLRLFRPLVLPFLLTSFLLGLLGTAEKASRDWEEKRREAVFREEAVHRAESFRANGTFEGRVRRLNSGFRNRILELHRAWKIISPLAAWLARWEKRLGGWVPDFLPHALGSRESWFGAFLGSTFERSFDPGCRPRGTLLYAYRVSSDGAVHPVRGPLLERTYERQFQIAFSQLLSFEEMSFDEQGSARTAWEKRFGRASPIDLVAIHRRGAPTIVRFVGRTWFLLWDFVGRKGMTKWGFLALVPVRAAFDSRPLGHALAAMDRGGKHGGTAVLVPIEGCTREFPDAFFPGGRAQRYLRDLVRKIRGMGEREKVFPSGRMVRFGEDFGFREFLWSSSSFELWILFPAQGPVGFLRRFPITALFMVAIGLAWMIVFFNLLLNRRSIGLGLRIWLPASLVLVGALPLTALYLMGSMQIEVSLSRETQARCDEAVSSLEEIDSGNAFILSRFREIGQKIFSDPGWREKVLKIGRTALLPAAREALAFFRTAGIPLQSILVFPPTNSPTIFTWGKEFGKGAERSLMLPFGAVMNSSLAALGKSNFYSPTSSVQDSQGKLFSSRKGWGLLESIGDMESDSVAWGLGRGADFAIGGKKLLTFSDFLWEKGVPISFVAFTSSADLAFRLRLRRVVSSFNRIADPFQFIGLGRRTPDGFLPDAPPLRGKTWHTGFGKALRKTMETASRFGSRQTLKRDGGLLVGFPCFESPGLVLGTHIPLGDLEVSAHNRRFLLRFLTLVILAFIIVSGKTASDRLVLPLEKVRDGLLGVGRGDLGIRVGMDRDDELGLLTRTFDEMTEGLAKRRELGRFVSGVLDRNVSTLSPSGDPEAGEGAILVSDLRSFTTISERFTPEEVVSMLNGHFDAMSEPITRHRGLIEKFIGDAIVAVFPDQPGDSGLLRALLAASEMRSSHLGIQELRRRSGLFEYEMGVGIEHGRILSGTLRTSGRMEFAIVGSARAKAEHLESLSRSGKSTRIVLSKDGARLAREGVAAQPGFGGSGNSGDYGFSPFPAVSFIPLPQGEGLELEKLLSGMGDREGSPGPVAPGSSGLPSRGGDA